MMHSCPVDNQSELWKLLAQGKKSKISLTARRVAGRPGGLAGRTGRVGAQLAGPALR
jgi:hypothetical protein